eukprot:13569586-Ditylum_brightwellii.AAC.1
MVIEDCLLALEELVVSRTKDGEGGLTKGLGSHPHSEEKTLKNVHVCVYCLLVHYFNGKMSSCPYKAMLKTEVKKKEKTAIVALYPEGELSTDAERMSSLALPGDSAPHEDFLMEKNIDTKNSENNLALVPTKIPLNDGAKRVNYVSVQDTIDLIQETWKKHRCIAPIDSHPKVKHNSNPSVAWNRILPTQVADWGTKVDVVVVQGKHHTAKNHASVDNWTQVLDPLQWAWKPLLVIVREETRDALYY